MPLPSLSRQWRWLSMGEIRARRWVSFPPFWRWTTFTLTSESNYTIS